VWKSTSESGAPDNSSPSHFSVVARLRRAARNRHRHAIEQAARRWRGGRRDDSGRTRRKILISTQVAGQVFDKKRIEYLCKQDMMLPVFRAAGTSGEVRLPFQDLRFYLSKTIR
jgi:hypothetical protein